MEPTTLQLIAAIAIATPAAILALTSLGIAIWDQLKAWREWLVPTLGFVSFVLYYAALVWAGKILLSYL